MAAYVLTNLGVGSRGIAREVERHVPKHPPLDSMVNKLPQTPRAKKIIEYAIEEARNLNHSFVGPEHLLLGLVREQNGAAAQVLMNLGLRLENVRAETLAILAWPSENKGNDKNSSHSRIRYGGRIKWGSWLLTIISCDGLLPPCVLLVPYLIEILVPNNPGAIEVAAVLLPIMGFLVRLVIGIRRIKTNQCSESIRAIQLCFLILGICVLVFIDSFLIISHLIPNSTMREQK